VPAAQLRELEAENSQQDYCADGQDLLLAPGALLGQRRCG
jgi:hypothetical protein